jgi:demethylmenaquinone methyltransferase/2-methoxy-6-polyprenyl-1,4-benzoquinol methylase
MKNLFARIANRYDTMNRIMSLGMDCLWRRSALKHIKLPEGCKILDLACGTGDFTIELARRWPNAEIIGADLTPEMLDIAHEKLSAIQNVTYQGALSPLVHNHHNREASTSSQQT